MIGLILVDRGQFVSFLALVEQELFTFPEHLSSLHFVFAYWTFFMEIEKMELIYEISVGIIFNCKFYFNKSNGVDCNVSFYAGSLTWVQLLGRFLTFNPHVTLLSENEGNQNT
jgi:hypothetical protein